MREKIKRIAIVLNAVVLIALALIYQSHFLRSIDNLLLDYNMTEAKQGHPDEHIVVVAIDDESLQELGRFPWDRAVYPQFLDMINQPGSEPKAIAFDVLFNEESNADSDAAFAEGLSQYNNVILPVVGNTEGDVFNTITVNPKEWPEVYSLSKPIPTIADHVELAHINRVISNDAVIRQTWLKIRTKDGEVVPSLAYQAAKMYGADLSRYDALTDPNSEPGKKSARNTLTIDYQNVTSDFLTVGFSRVLNGEIDPSVFKDAIVLVGFTAVGLSDDAGQDSGTTPIEKNMKLVYVHANIVDQLLKGTLVHHTAVWIEVLAGLLLFALFILVPWRMKNIYSILVFLAVVAGILFGQYLYYQESTTVVKTADVILAITLAYLTNVSLKSYLESSQKSFVTRQFGRYISPDLVKQIVAQDIDIKLGGDSKNITILFLDIRGFTPLSEKLTPPELVDTLNTMFNMITETTLRNRGTIDKFIGDAAMILFNAPLDVENHAVMAVKTAYEIQQSMKKIRDEILERYGVEVNVGIGIHTGNVVVGNIGSYLRVDYTAIGDNVNIAARIESQTKKGQIHVSEHVHELAKDYFSFDEGEDRMFKGKSHPIRVYEVLGKLEGARALEEAAVSKAD
ncbi:CHASE2 domain-containing protein [Cohnella sp. CFH 77786]|uniref:CHASE2 domain-containing protein n=1 Tax=Cohnella sp. CFH 77786 TaxID=2662265 RepID=UPI001C60F150|nr:adenylate/guanylate cyclase domain-containing protein [Cohnella sp. CFH 77786]MBW5445100.1 CHASE2 domain-containing protein [Cohnella sp. CFH 77786]